MSAEQFRTEFGGVKASPVPSTKMRLPKTPKMTYTEASYHRLLQAEFAGPYQIHFERLTLILDSGARYTPDFTVWDGRALLLCVEVKGRTKLKSFDRATTKFKEAITSFPEILFRHAFLGADGQWNIQEKRFNAPSK